MNLKPNDRLENLIVELEENPKIIGEYVFSKKKEVLEDRTFKWLFCEDYCKCDDHDPCPSDYPDCVPYNHCDH